MSEEKQPETFEIKGVVYAVHQEHNDTFHYVFTEHKEMESVGWVKVLEVSKHVDLPVDFNPRFHLLGALEKQKEAARQEFNKKVFEINKKITKLQVLSAPKTDNGMEIMDAEPQAASFFKPCDPSDPDYIPF